MLYTKVDGFEIDFENDYVKTPAGFWHRVEDGFSPEAEAAGDLGETSYAQYDKWLALVQSR